MLASHTCLWSSRMPVSVRSRRASTRAGPEAQCRTEQLCRVMPLVPRNDLWLSLCPTIQRKQTTRYAPAFFEMGGPRHTLP